MQSLFLEPLPYHADSLILMGKLRDLPYCVFLDSGKPDSPQGRYDILSAAPDTILIAEKDRYIDIVRSGKHQMVEQDLFNLIPTFLKELHKKQHPSTTLPFIGGAVGFYAYDLSRNLEKLPSIANADIPLPYAVVGIYLWAVIQDHDKQQCWLVAQPNVSTTLTADIKRRVYSEPVIDEVSFQLTTPFISQINRSDYRTSFEAVQRYIRQGDCYQVNLAQRFSAQCRGDSWVAYQQIRRRLPAPYSAYFDIGNFQILSFSPERFIRVEGAQVETKPIKGTRPRSTDLFTDQQLQKDLLVSAKDRAENLMIVDLLRNDLGKCCEPGSITVDKLFDIESFANVHHLVSTIHGHLRKSESPLSLLKACFPGGSITGAPKIRAMEIIEELETTRRGIYCGSIAYCSADGRFDSNIAIRTALRYDDQIYCWGGGGIVADSNCEQEYQESIDKIQLIMDALSTDTSTDTRT